MIRACTERETERLKAYIEGDYQKAIYLYIDLARYGCETPNVRVYCQEDAQGELTALFLLYYDCLHCYSRGNDFDRDEVAEFLLEREPHTVFLFSTFFDRLGMDISAYEKHETILFQALPYRMEDSVALEQVTADQAEEIADFLLTEPVYAEVYERDVLCRQLRERLEQGFSRSWVLREKGRIVFHMGSMAEEGPIAIGGLGMLGGELRGKGMGKLLFASTYNIFLREGKLTYCYNIDERARRMHSSMGYAEQGVVVKLTKQNEP